MPVAVLNIRTPLAQGDATVRIDSRNREIAYEAVDESVLLYMPRRNGQSGYCGTAEIVDIRIDVLAPRFIFVELRNVSLFPVLLLTREMAEPFESGARDVEGRPIFSYFSIGIRKLTAADQDVIAKWSGSGLFEQRQTPFGPHERARATKIYAVRDMRLRNETLLHYGAGCAVCRRHHCDAERGLHEVEVCHLLAVEMGGSDEVDNAMPMCRLHHWAYDHGLFSMTDAGIFLFGSAMTKDLKAEFRGHLCALSPRSPMAYPKASNLAARRRLVYRGKVGEDQAL